MRINHNISALQTGANMKRTGNALDKAMERLSSGYKINRAADDAAGMAISRKMRTQIDGLERSSMNALDGISVIQTAEGALNEVTSILQRCRELSVQAANDVNTVDDKKAIQQEINALMEEVDRISKETEFNTKPLLDGNLDNNSYTDVSGIELVYSSEAVEKSTNGYKFTVNQPAKQAEAKWGGLSGLKNSNAKIGKSGTISINGTSVEINENDTKAECYNKIFDACDIMDIRLGSDGTMKTEAYGSSQKIDIKCDDGLKSVLGNPPGLKAGTDVKVTLDTSNNSDFKTDAIKSEDGNIVTVKSQGGVEMKFRIEPDVAGGSKATATVLDAGAMYLQVGTKENQAIGVKIPRVDSETLGISDANVISHDGAERAISLFDNAVNLVSSIRARLGAYQNRLEHTIENLETANLNMTEAMSRISDADMAEEMTNFTQQNVLQQAGTSILAQANERPQTILSLLNG